MIKNFKRLKGKDIHIIENTTPKNKPIKPKDFEKLEENYKKVFGEINYKKVVDEIID